MTPRVKSRRGIQRGHLSLVTEALAPALPTAPTPAGERPRMIVCRAEHTDRRLGVRAGDQVLTDPETWKSWIMRVPRWRTSALRHGIERGVLVPESHQRDLLLLSLSIWPPDTSATTTTI